MYFAYNDEDNIYDLLFGPAPKPRQEMEAMFEQLIKLLDRTKNQLYIRVARYFLLLDLDSRNNLSELPVITVFLLHASNKLFKNVALRKRFLMERVIYEDEPIYCVLVGMNSNKKFTKVITQIIGPEQFQALPNSAYKQLKSTRENIAKSRNSKKL